MPQCLVRLRRTTRPGGADPARDWRSPGTASMNASSTTTSRPGRTSPAIVSAGWRTPVGLVGLPTTTRSASSGIELGSNAKSPSGSQRTSVTWCPACSSAACGSVNCGCTTTGRRHGRSRATRVNASAAPAVASTSSAGRPWTAATAASAYVGLGVATDPVEAVAQGAVQPGRGRTREHVDGEVEQPVGGLDVAVVPEGALEWVSHGRGPRRRTAGRAAGGRPSGCAGRTRAGSATGVSDGLTVDATRPAPRRPGGSTRGAVELVPGHPLAGAGQQVVGGRRHRGVAQGQPLGHRGRRVDRTDHGEDVQ